MEQQDFSKMQKILQELILEELELKQEVTKKEKTNSLKISRDKFLEVLDALERYTQYQMECDEALKTLFPKDSVSFFGEDILQDTLIDLLVYLTNDEHDLIRFFIFNTKFGTTMTDGVVLYKGETHNLESSKDLWNLLKLN